MHYPVERTRPQQFGAAFTGLTDFSVGSSVHGTMIDLWFPTLAQARAWGRRAIMITLH